MGEVLKDAYEQERKKRDYKAKLGNLMYEYALVCGMVSYYQKRLSVVNEKIDSVVKEISDEGSKL